MATKAAASFGSASALELELELELVPRRRRSNHHHHHHHVSFAIRSSQSMDHDNVYKELGLFSLKKKIEDAVNRAEMIAPLALDVAEARRIEQEEMLLDYNLWNDSARSNDSLLALSNAIKVVNELKDLRYKAEEAKLISQLADMDIINGHLFKQAYQSSMDICKFLDRYEMSKLLSGLSGPLDKEGACVIVTAGSEGVTSEMWADNILKMYKRWSKKHGCEGRVTEKHPSKGGGGIRSATLEFEKEFVYGHLSGEKGVHKMIRSSLDGSVVRETCSASVDVIPLFLENPLDLLIDEKDIEISSQASHSHNESTCVTEPSVSVHHLPSRITIQCSGERSHFANKMKGLNRLKAKLFVLMMEQGVSEVDQVKGDSTENEKHEMRRYMSSPHRLVQDVRTGLHLPDLNCVMNGNIEPLIRAHLILRQAREVI